jgi:hypothetical protein
LVPQKYSLTDKKRGKRNANIYGRRNRLVRIKPTRILAEKDIAILD